LSLFQFQIDVIFVNVVTIIELIFRTPIPSRSPAKALSACGNSPITTYASQMAAMSSSCSSRAQSMQVSGTSFSESEVSFSELTKLFYMESTLVTIELQYSMISVCTGNAPTTSSFTEPSVPPPPANLNASSTVTTNITIAMQAQWMLTYIPFVIAQVNDTGKTCEGMSASVNTSCNCPNTTSVQSVLDLWGNVTVQVTALLNVTVVNGTLLAYLNETTTVGGNITAAINATNNLLIQQQVRKYFDVYFEF
jgi:hypothetical protein